MKKVITLLVALILAFSAVMPVLAAESNVVYSGKSGEFVFTPGSEQSPTDLFTEFKDVMPGDTLTQKITVENKASNDVKVKIYLRSLGADEKSVDFLSQLNLRVKASEENEMGYMFDAKANETAGLTDWVCLGTLYSGGKVNLDVLLDVPASLDNTFQDNIGSLDWEFKVEEFPIEKDDPDVDDKPDDKGDEDTQENPDDDDDKKTPQTGDASNPTLWLIVLISCGILMALILVLKRHKNR